MESLLRKFDSLELNELHRAVHNNDLETVKYLLKEGADIANTINDGQTPLHFAAKLNYQLITQELLKNKSREEMRSVINRRTLDTGTAALHLAVRNNSLESTKFLLSRGANFEIQDHQNRQPKHQTIDKPILQLIDRIEIVFESTLTSNSDILLEKLNFCSGENLESVMYARNRQGFTALQCAMEKNQLDAMATIIDFRIGKLKQNPWQADGKFDKLMQISKAARLNLSNFDDFCHENDDVSLIDANIKGEAMNLLRNAHEFLESCKKKRNPSLDGQPMLIVIEESLEFFGFTKASKFIENKRVDLMLRKGPLFVARMLKLCIGVPMQFFTRLIYSSELLLAAKRNDWILAKKCLTGHPDLNEEDTDGSTALRYAFKHKNDEMIKMLMRCGADPMSEEKGITQKEPFLLFALRHICRSPHELDIMQLVFERVSDDKWFDFVNVKDQNSSTPLHYIGTNIRLVQFLMCNGAIYCAKDCDRRAPKDYYCRYRRPYALVLLEHVDHLFTHARNGRAKELVEEMKERDDLDLLAIGGTRDERGQTLIHVLELKGHVEEAKQIRGLLSSKECEHLKRNVADFFRYGTSVCSK